MNIMMLSTLSCRCIPVRKTSQKIHTFFWEFFGHFWPYTNTEQPISFLIPSASSSSWHWSKCMASDAPDLHKEPVNRPTNQLARSLLDVSICLTRVFRAQPRFIAMCPHLLFFFRSFNGSHVYSR